MDSPQSRPASDWLVALYLLLDAARDRFRRLRRLRDGRLDGRDRLVRDFLGDLRSRLRRGSDGIRNVLRRPGRLSASGLTVLATSSIAGRTALTALSNVGWSSFAARSIAAPAASTAFLAALSASRRSRSISLRGAPQDGQ